MPTANEKQFDQALDALVRIRDGQNASSGQSRTQGNGGGKRPGGAATSPWTCCECGYYNFEGRHICRKCPARRPAAPRGGTSAGGKGKGGKGGDTSGAAGGGTSLAERQLQRQRDDLRAQKKKADEELKRLRDENARLATAAEAARPAGGGVAQTGEGDVDGAEEEMDCSEAYASWTEDERKEQLEVARGGLAYATKRYGEASAEADAVRAEIEALQRASREAKPFRAHRAQLERRRDKLRRQQERDGEEITKVENAIAEQQSKLEELRTAVSDRSKSLASVEEELTELIKKALAEEKTGNEDPAAWSTSAATDAIKAMATKPGIPAGVSALLEQVQLALAALAAEAPGSGGSAQQQSQHQQQQRQQGTALGTTTTDDATTGRDGLAQATGLTAAAPASLAPQGRWAKGPQTAGLLANMGGAASAGSGAGGTVDATITTTTSTHLAAAPAAAAATGKPAAPTPVGTAAAESEEELLEDSGAADGQMEVDVENSICKLPAEDQATLRQALKARGGISRRRRSDDDDSARGRDRERSPRLAKKGGSEQEGHDEI